MDVKIMYPIAAEAENPNTSSINISGQINPP